MTSATINFNILAAAVLCMSHEAKKHLTRAILLLTSDISLPKVEQFSHNFMTQSLIMKSKTEEIALTTLTSEISFFFCVENAGMNE